jgi:phosphatidate cytidylyltransferase
MKELIQRSFFGLLYVLAVILALQTYSWTVVLLGVFMLTGLKEFSRLVDLNYQTALLPVIFIYIFSFLYHYQTVIDVKVLQVAGGFMLISLFIPMIYFIFDKIERAMLGNFYMSVFYLAIPFSLALGIEGKLLLYVFVIIWSSDSFAYLTGKYFGKHKLAEKISPKKTIEGFAGGLISSLLIAYLIFSYMGGYKQISLLQFLLLALLIVLTGTLGDLLESRFKRLANVKDSGSLIPGHGGVLDRLDSFIFAVPFVYAYLLII